jgi:hypothetical protein
MAYITKIIGSENNPLATPANGYTVAALSAADDGCTVSYSPGGTCQQLATASVVATQGTYDMPAPELALQRPEMNAAGRTRVTR